MLARTRIPLLVAALVAVAALGAAPAHAAIEGQRTALLVIAGWQAKDGDPGAVPDITAADGIHTMNDIVNPWYRTVSHGLFDGWQTTVRGPIAIQPPQQDPDPKKRCANVWLDDFSRQADAAMREQGIEPEDYDQIMYKFGDGDRGLYSCPWFGVIDAPLHRIWINGRNVHGLAETGIHELAHSIGLGHSNALACRDAGGAPVPFSATCSGVAFGDPYSILSAQWDGPFPADMRDQLGWMGDRLARLTAGDWSQRLVLRNLGDDGGTQAVRLDDGVRLWLEYRAMTGLDDPESPLVVGRLTPGVLVRAEVGGESARLLGFGADYDDAPLRVGQPWVNPLGMMRITVESIGDAGATVVVEANRTTVPALRGMGLATARSALTAAGLALGSQFLQVDKSCELVNAVMAQSPPAGARVVPGTRVDVTLGTMPSRGCQ